MTEPLTSAEFAVLRQTIAIRGTARMALLPVTCLGWAVLTLVAAALRRAAGRRASSRWRCWSVGSRPFTRCTSAPSGSAATCRSTTRRSPTARDGKPRRWPSGRRCPAAASIRCSRWSSSARRRQPVPALAPSADSGGTRRRRPAPRWLRVPHRARAAGGRRAAGGGARKLQGDAVARARRAASPALQTLEGDPPLSVDRHSVVALVATTQRHPAARPRPSTLRGIPNVSLTTAQALIQSESRCTSAVQSLLIRDATEVGNESGAAPGISNPDLRMRNRPVSRAGDQPRADLRRGERSGLRASRSSPQSHDRCRPRRRRSVASLAVKVS